MTIFSSDDLSSGPAPDSGATARWRAIDGELVSYFEGSERTIYRDLAALEQRGIAIERSEHGYRLMRSAMIRPLNLSPAERLLLSLALDNPALTAQRPSTTV